MDQLQPFILSQVLCIMTISNLSMLFSNLDQSSVGPHHFYLKTSHSHVIFVHDLQTYEIPNTLLYVECVAKYLNSFQIKY